MEVAKVGPLQLVVLLNHGQYLPKQTKFCLVCGHLKSYFLCKNYFLHFSGIK